MPHNGNNFWESAALADVCALLSAILVLYLLLGRLPNVDLIILEGEKCPSVRPSTKSFFDLNEIWYIGRGR